MHIPRANHQRALYYCRRQVGRSDRSGQTNPTNDQAPGYAAEPFSLGSAATQAIWNRQLAPGTPDTDPCFASTLTWRRWNSVFGSDCWLCSTPEIAATTILPNSCAGVPRLEGAKKEQGHAQSLCRPVMRRSRSTTTRGAQCCKLAVVGRCVCVGSLGS